MSGPELLLGGRVQLYSGDSRDVLRALPDASIDSVVTDPPYALVSIGKRFGKPGSAAVKVPEGGTGAYARASAGFMGKSWDTGETAFAIGFWREVLRVLKPGGHVVAFGGTRSYHRLACAIEDAGFEKRDSIADLFDIVPEVRAFVESLSPAQLDAFLRIADVLEFDGLLAWAYGTGFPKSLDVSKAIDKAAGKGRPVVGSRRKAQSFADGQVYGAKPDKGGVQRLTAPAAAAAAAWKGWGTALKPAWEPIVLARKPLIGTVVENVLAHGTGALNIDGCRVHADDKMGGAYTVTRLKPGAMLNSTGGNWRPEEGGLIYRGEMKPGRHPANIVHDGSDEVVAAFPDSAGQQGVVTGDEPSSPFANVYGDMPSRAGRAEPRGDTGSAARFFYSAKAGADDRIGSKHPTVKPVDLMRWLCRLVTPPGGVVLDPFAGTGATGEAAWREGFSAVLIEREGEYQADIRRRMDLATEGPAMRAAERVKARGREADAGPLFQAASGRPGSSGE